MPKTTNLPRFALADYVLVTITVLAVAACIPRLIALSPWGGISSGARTTPGIDYGVTLNLELDRNAMHGAIAIALSGDEYMLPSLSLYRTMVRHATERGIQVRLLLPSPKDAYLADLLHVPHNARRFGPLRAYGITDTPALIMTTETGLVQELWLGNPTAFEQRRMLEMLETLDRVPIRTARVQHERILLVAAAADAKNRPSTVLDVRKRLDYSTGSTPSVSINIPADELPTRARNEIDQSRPVIIDCTYTEAGFCKYAAGTLLHRGFREVSILNLGVFRRASCALPREE